MTTARTLEKRRDVDVSSADATQLWFRRHSNASAKKSHEIFMSGLRIKLGEAIATISERKGLK